MQMGSVRFQFGHVGFLPKPQMPTFYHRHSSGCIILSASPKILCGLRNGPRKPMWRSRVLSTEAIQVVQSLKLARSTSKLDEVFNSRLTRLLKADLMDTLAELQRQNEFDLALKVFEYVRKEVWYTPDLSFFSDMIRMLGKNKLIDMAESFFSELKKEGLEPDTRTYAEMLGAYLGVGLVEKAMDTYRLMKSSGCTPDKLTFTILVKNLENVGEEELATIVKNECAEYMNYPDQFLKDIKKKYPKQRSLDPV